MAEKVNQVRKIRHCVGKSNIFAIKEGNCTRGFDFCEMDFGLAKPAKFPENLSIGG